MCLFANASQDKIRMGLCSLCKKERQTIADGLYMKYDSLKAVTKSILRNEPCHKCSTKILSELKNDTISLLQLFKELGSLCTLFQQPLSGNKTTDRKSEA